MIAEIFLAKVLSHCCCPELLSHERLNSADFGCRAAPSSRESKGTQYMFEAATQRQELLHRALLRKLTGQSLELQATDAASSCVRSSLADGERECQRFPIGFACRVPE